MKRIEDDKILNEIISSIKGYNESYIEGSWERFQKKRRQKKKRKILLPIFSGAVAAIFLLSIIIYSTFNNDLKSDKHLTLNPEAEKSKNEETEQEMPVKTYVFPSRERSISFIKKIRSNDFQISSQNNLLALAPINNPIPNKALLQENNIQNATPADSNKIVALTFVDSTLAINSNEIIQHSPENKTSRKKISFGFLLKESINSTHSSSDMSFAFGFVNEVKFTKKLSINTGIIFDKYNLLYEHDEVFTYNDPVSVNAELMCFDIPVNLKLQVAEMRKSNIFITGGVSSLIFIKESYNQQYFFAEPTVTTVNFQNINFAGQLNFSSGWQYHISNKMNLSIEAYMKVPLYKLAEEKLQFYQSGISLKISK